MVSVIGEESMREPIQPVAYVYAITVDGIVRYIGKGRGRRLNVHLNIAKLITRRRACGEKISSSIFRERMKAGAAMKYGAERRRALWADPEYRELVSSRQRAAMADPAWRAKMSEAAKARYAKRKQQHD